MKFESCHLIPLLWTILPITTNRTHLYTIVRLRCHIPALHWNDQPFLTAKCTCIVIPQQRQHGGQSIERSWAIPFRIHIWPINWWWLAWFTGTRIRELFVTIQHMLERGGAGQKEAHHYDHCISQQTDTLIVEYVNKAIILKIIMYSRISTYKYRLICVVTGSAGRPPKYLYNPEDRKYEANHKCRRNRNKTIPVCWLNYVALEVIIVEWNFNKPAITFLARDSVHSAWPRIGWQTAMYRSMVKLTVR